MTTFLRKLSLYDWRQFGHVDLDLNHQVVVLTGINGSGKTTVLRLLAQLTGEPAAFLSTPQRTEGGRFEWFGGFSRRWLGDLFKLRNIPSTKEVGQVELASGLKATLSVPIRPGNAHLPITSSHLEAIPGFFISSHRPLFYYEEVSNVTLKRTPRPDAFQQYLEAIRRQTQAGQRVNNVSSQIKRTLLNWGYVGYGSQVAPPDRELMENFEGFQEVLRKIFPSELRFERYEIRSGSEIVFVTANGEFLFETASGGITSLIHLSWLIYNFSEGRPCTILVDEIENHLHPALQRIVLPNLLDAFPHVRFIVTTHSPLVVTSVQHARVYALHNNDEGRMVASLLDFNQSALGAAAILDKVLGVPVTMPIWAERKYESILNRYAMLEKNEATLRSFHRELKEAGLETLVFPGLETFLGRE